MMTYGNNLVSLKAGDMMESKMIIRCLCGREIVLEMYGGQYQTEYRGHCECGRKWVLTEISELMAEIEEP